MTASVLIRFIIYRVTAFSNSLENISVVNKRIKITFIYLLRPTYFNISVAILKEKHKNLKVEVTEGFTYTHTHTHTYIYIYIYIYI